jgi:hypothetical protein
MVDTYIATEKEIDAKKKKGILDYMKYDLFNLNVNNEGFHQDLTFDESQDITNLENSKIENILLNREQKDLEQDEKERKRKEEQMRIYNLKNNHADGGGHY